ncbi:hypothetical protein [Escherichia coli]|uniref:hypothetical protein n=1 Tax=Escherichia coli TaxID=562 RepID=UPI00131EDAA0|nr:hypothetical protein [Escherichia coli]
MDSETIHEAVRSGVIGVSETEPSGWRSGNSGQRLRMYGGWLLILLPVLTGSSLRGREQNTANGAAGVRPDIHHVLQEVVDVRRKSKNMHIGLTPSRCSVAQRRKREKASFPRFRRFDIICEWHLSYIQT